MGSYFSSAAAGRSTAIPAVENFDLVKFMGDWWVIANIPLPPEWSAYGSCEHYELIAPDRVDVTFSFNNGSLDGPIRQYKSKGYVDPETPSRWAVQFFWPIKAEYVVSYVDPDYQTTIVGRSRRDFVWIMSRSKTMDEETYQNLVAKVKELGYDERKLNRVQQKPFPLATSD